MKKILLFVALVATAFCANAQVNIQEQYDFNREHLTTTLEMFKMDDWGSTFFFTDIYHPDKLNGPTGYYTEIARGLNFWQNTPLSPLSLQVEYNGLVGVNQTFIDFLSKSIPSSINSSNFFMFFIFQFFSAMSNVSSR